MQQSMSYQLSNFSLPRLIVVAEKSTVYKFFPIPLINRLEKHFLLMSSNLTDKESQLCHEIERWAHMFSERKFAQ